MISIIWSSFNPRRVRSSSPPIFHREPNFPSIHPSIHSSIRYYALFENIQTPEHSFEANNIFKRISMGKYYAIKVGNERPPIGIRVFAIHFNVADQTVGLSCGLSAKINK